MKQKFEITKLQNKLEVFSIILDLFQFPPPTETICEKYFDYPDVKQTGNLKDKEIITCMGSLAIQAFI